MVDLVVVGGGIAGLCAALAAPVGVRIVVIDKGEAGAGSSPLAQGGLAAAVGPDDTPTLHAADTIAAGAGICDQDVVADICAEGPAAVAWLASMGCAFDRSSDGSLHLAREGGQSVARSVHWRDATGAEIVRALRAAVRDRSIARVTGRVARLHVSDGRCDGVVVDGELRAGRSVLLATGGAGALWGRTTNAPGATGDGIALALDAGAQVADLEYMQFHPTALDHPGAQRVLLTEALRGDGAILVDRHGQRFVDELAPRHVVAHAILAQPQAFLDCRPVEQLEDRFPTIVAAARAHGFDPSSAPLPVAPAAHYFIGGVAADAHGRTSLPGLAAAGECAATGMHGANRMAGNSLLESVVVGRRVGERVGDEPAVRAGGLFGDAPQAADLVRDELDPAIPGIMWTGVGPVRDATGLAGALEALDRLRDSSHRTLAAMIARAALARAESRGVHHRTDAPTADPAFAQRSFDRRPPRVPH